MKLQVLLLIALNCYAHCGAALRRTPKVYNALITTDDNLTASRAYPVIQPTIHETGIAQYPFGPYNPYSYYGTPLVRFGQPITPGLEPRAQLPYPWPQAQFPPQLVPQTTDVPRIEQQPETPKPEQQEIPKQPPPTPPPQQQAPNRYPFPTVQGYPPTNRAPQMPPQRSPIPLNQFGLPPSLIPVPQNPYQNGYPMRLPPYRFSQYPLTYNPYTGIHEQYLPPYDYVPNHTFGVTAPPPNRPQAPIQNTPPPPPAPETPKDEEQTTEYESSQSITQPTDVPNFDNIKNGVENKNNKVPDVPPPPIPSGGKSQQA